jgi:hypothetical protein
MKRIVLPIVLSTMFFPLTAVFAHEENMDQMSITSTIDAEGVTQTQQISPSIGPSQTITTVEEDLSGNAKSEVDSASIKTQTTTPSTNEMPLWEQALQPDATSTTTFQDLKKYGGHTEVTIIQEQITTPSTSDVPAWEQALQPPATTTTITKEKDMMMQDGDGITTINSQTIGPIPAWDKKQH